MARSNLLSLTDLSSITIASCLQKRVVVPNKPIRYKPHHYNLQEVNPFSCFPPLIVEQLVNAVYKTTRATRKRHYKRWCVSWILRPLLLSGRIENLTVYIVDRDFDDTLNILTMMLSNAHKLKSLRLKIDEMSDIRDYRKMTDKFNLLLSAAVNLEYLYTDLVFDFRKLEKLGNLHKIKFTKFTKISRIETFEEIFDEVLQGRISKVGTAYLLQKLPQLHSVNWDIAEALELIHGKDHISEINETYQLRKACLHALTEKQLDIFARTCPHVEKLTLVVDELEGLELHNPPVQIIEMKNVVHLKIKVGLVSRECSYYETEDIYTPDEFQAYASMSASELVTLLSHLKGGILKILKLKFYINDLDVQLLSSLCPNLQVLHLGLSSDVQPSKPLQTCFPQLKQLHVMFDLSDNFCIDTLLLLTSSLTLYSLYLEGVEFLSDEVMTDILKRNPLSCLQSLFLGGCSLTHNGLLKVIRQCSNLREIKYNSRANNFPKEAFTEMAQTINPQLRITF